MGRIVQHRLARRPLAVDLDPEVDAPAQLVRTREVVVAAQIVAGHEILAIGMDHGRNPRQCRQQQQDGRDQNPPMQHCPDVDRRLKRLEFAPFWPCAAGLRRTNGIGVRLVVGRCLPDGGECYQESSLR